MKPKEKKVKTNLRGEPLVNRQKAASIAMNPKIETTNILCGGIFQAPHLTKFWRREFEKNQMLPIRIKSCISTDCTSRSLNIFGLFANSTKAMTPTKNVIPMTHFFVPVNSAHRKRIGVVRLRHRKPIDRNTKS
jgi:hypothetical protein